jgi:DNA-binding response OmpR family regulator
VDVPEGLLGYTFGDYRLDVARQALYCASADSWTPLTRRVFDTLLYLVEHADRVKSA